MHKLHSSLNLRIFPSLWSLIINIWKLVDEPVAKQHKNPFEVTTNALFFASPFPLATSKKVASLYAPRLDADLPSITPAIVFFVCALEGVD